MMVGGIPRDPERRKNLPLINKLYGHLALKLTEQNTSSLLYNQPATGGSTGDWETETLESRSRIIVELATHLSSETKIKELKLLGTSSGAYMSASVIQNLQDSGLNVSRVALLSPAAYPKGAETIPYGARFTNAVNTQWDLEDSPVFSKLESYIRSGGSLFISFFEADDPPIPQSIQTYYQAFVQDQIESGRKIELYTIPGVAHNFRRIGVHEKGNIVDNNSIRATAIKLQKFLAT
jgi:hypothetical protein